MIESTTYMDSVRNHELVPQFTLSAFDNPDDEWSLYENLDILGRANEQFTGEMKHNLVSRKNKHTNNIFIEIK